MKGLTDIPGIKVGHASDFDAITGCTAILCESGAVAGVDVRGSASDTVALGTLDPGHITPTIHGISLAGGSAFGLEAASGMRRYLEHRGVGFDTRVAKVPIVPGAILFDLGIGKPGVRPTREMGEAAAAAATDAAVKEGCIGAGTGATVGKLYGMKQAMKGGLGSATVVLGSGVLVSALVAVNAFGDIRDPQSGKLVAGARRAADSREFADTQEQMKRGAAGRFAGGNTTLAVVATTAKLDKVAATKLAQLAGLGMARTIYPVNTMMDGDIVFAMSIGSARADINILGLAAADALAEAILRAVRLATTMGGVPGLAG